MATYFFICLLVFYQATILWANTEFPSKVPPTQTDDFNDRKSASEDSFNDDDDYNDDNGPNDMDNEVLTNITTKMDVVSTTSSSSSSIMTDDSTEFTKSTPAPMSKVNAVSNKNFLQELLLLSTSWTEVQRQLQLLNKHLDGIKSAFIRYETNVKEELVAIQEDIQSLKATSGELETDLQTVSETLERIQDWTSNVDKKFLTLEKFMHNERKSKKRHQDNSEICMRCGKIHKKKKLINDFQTKTETRSSVDFIQKPQADSEATASQQISSLKYSDNKCDVNMKDGIQMLKDHCSGKTFKLISSSNLLLNPNDQTL